jgi:hypothetical protein
VLLIAITVVVLANLILAVLVTLIIVIATVSTLVVILILVLTIEMRLTVGTVLLIAWHALVILALLLHGGHKHLNNRGDLFNVFVFVLRG